MPGELAHVWRHFVRLSSRRGGNGFAINPISYLDIEAYCRLAGVRFDAFELRLIEDLDNLYRLPRKAKDE